jgi:DNA adenine methylase
MTVVRYVGGKSRAVPCLLEYWRETFGKVNTVVSPFFGGGSFEFALLKDGYAKRAQANDIDYRLIAFWREAKKRSPAFLAQTKRLRLITKDRFQKARSRILNDQRNRVENLERKRENRNLKADKRLSMLPVLSQSQLAVEYWVLNLVSFSGLGMSGGYSSYVADVVAKRGTVIPKVPRIHQVSFSQNDWETFLDRVLKIRKPGTVLYLDPPYYFKGKVPSLYGTNGDLIRGFDHQALANYLKNVDGWMLSYNNCREIRKLYAGYTQHKCNWNYTMSDTSRKRSAGKRKAELVVLCPFQSQSNTVSPIQRRKSQR